MAFIAVIFITAMELWSIVFAIFFMFLVIVLIFWFFEWITGADLDSVKGGFELSFYGGLKMHDLGGLRINRC